MGIMGSRLTRSPAAILWPISSSVHTNAFEGWNLPPGENFFEVGALWYSGACRAMSFGSCHTLNAHLQRRCELLNISHCGGVASSVIATRHAGCHPSERAERSFGLIGS